MNINFTTKEKLLLEEQKNQEQLCVQKYSEYENRASDPQLKNIFRTNGQHEQQHLNTINQLISGQVPSMNNQSQSQSQQQMQSQQMNSQQMDSQQMKSQMTQSQQQMSNSNKPQSSSMNNQSCDKDLCSDALMTEKFVSGVYNTAIFEFKDTQVRDVLNHIQKEEQEHGDQIFKYMYSKGMYTLK